MKRLRIASVILALFALTACAGLLMQPAPGQPHATLTVNHVVSEIEGDSYNTRLLINDSLYDNTSYDPADIASNPVQVRLQLQEQTVTVAASTYQRATGPQQTTEERREEYACSREECDDADPPNCHLVEDTCVRTYTVPTYSSGESASRSEECQASVQIAPDVGHDYFISFEYRGENDCSATCYEHVEQAGGDYQRVPCQTAY